MWQPASALHSESPSDSQRRVVEAQGLVKFYGATAALRGCDLTVAAGERVALVGPNGAGKTTLLKLLATLVRPSAGRLWLFGVDAVRYPAVVRRRLGVVAHDTYLYRDLTVAENLALYGRLYGVADLRRRVAESVAWVGLAGQADRRVGALSRGQQQRVALARALLHAPALLLLDEPDAGLDEAGQALLAAVVREAAISVVLATHALERALALADRVVVLAAGRVVHEVATAGLTSEALRAIYRTVTNAAKQGPDEGSRPAGGAALPSPADTPVGQPVSLGSGEK
ncbi:MAG TPA: ATP-binding cassette domain-containing protein [Chloroflexota bacterium]|nr:ATP-binding cassette domain-containing protein [Chloroflexota bacterium]